MAAEDRDDKREKVYRTPTAGLWTATGLVIGYLVWAVVLSILTESGHLLNNQGFECGNSEESRLTEEAFLVFLWTGMALPICFMLLLNIWIKRTFYKPLSLLAIFVVFVAMTVTFAKTWEKENEEIEAFKDRYLELIPLTDVPGITQSHANDKNCSMLSNVYRWQAEFKCCGLEGYQDWGPGIPDSCLYEGENKSTGCVGAGNSLVYEKPCLPTVLSLVEKRSSTLWTVMITWITIVGVPASMFVFLMVKCCCWVFCEDCCYRLSFWKYKLSGGVEMITVVFIRKDNNNQPEEGNGKDEEERVSCSNGVVVDVEDGAGEEGADVFLDKNAATRIPLSELRRLQEELDPPPVQHQVRCLCISSRKPRSFYTVMIEEGSPLLPAGAVLADANKPTTCVWAEGPHVFSLEDIVWPEESKVINSLPL
ncbi:uncharacterized protein LOC117757468 isoform X1 [Hippoglossus hippoglossus]|uniref:uncharacterized protein LOC117757468 isoform X1 n=2 Tax=Hippoglossus hippoglossus TaxID=8267 RepID=UPI00148E3BF5|nr:uncharacterized protein LOC117757468 isoform X1 [Hippoglossus hippoglossus]